MRHAFVWFAFQSEIQVNEILGKMGKVVWVRNGSVRMEGPIVRGYNQKLELSKND